ncbi:hypothetical protein [Actinomadura madurae]|uniref:hypothetical protein n=1 Tax=Actinomadura madurae TaxID=1993 RepID=UPI0035584CD9
MEVSLARDGGGLVVRVADDGRGPSGDTPGGFGILGMIERARSVGGRWTPVRAPRADSPSPPCSRSPAPPRPSDGAEPPPGAASGRPEGFPTLTGRVRIKGDQGRRTRR